MNGYEIMEYHLDRGCTRVWCRVFEFFWTCSRKTSNRRNNYSPRRRFYTAVNGIYNKMASPALYGKNLSYELVDVISKRYQPLPVNTYLAALSTFAYGREREKNVGKYMDHGLQHDFEV